MPDRQTRQEGLDLRLVFQQSTVSLHRGPGSKRHVLEQKCTLKRSLVGIELELWGQELELWGPSQRGKEPHGGAE